jgi:hypothetical protein
VAWDRLLCAFTPSRWHPPPFHRVSDFENVLLNDVPRLSDEVRKPQQGGLPLKTALALHHRAKFERADLSCCCPRCGCLLTRHQPDPELADRLLATCDDCKSWYLTTNPSGTALSPIRRTKARPCRPLCMLTIDGDRPHTADFCDRTSLLGLSAASED